jgi:hypothetical protein
MTSARLFLFFLTVILTSCTVQSTVPSPELRQSLAPRGTLRVGLNLRRSFLVKRNASTGEITGIAVDLSHKRLPG